MKEERLLRAMTEIDTQLIQVHAPALAAKSATPQKRRPLRIVLIAAALCVASIGSALALSPTFRDVILASLGFHAPYATEVEVSCEDKGVKIEARSALTDGRVTRLYFTVHDPSGDFFLEDTDNDLHMDFMAGEDEVWGAGGKGLQLLSYDAEAQTGLYVYSQGTFREFGTEEIPAPTHAALRMSYFTPGQRYAGHTFFGPADGNCDLPLDTLKCTQENGVTVLLPDQNPQPIDSNEVSVTSMGFGTDGYYHVRVTQQEQVTGIYSDSPFQVNYWMVNPEDPNGPFDDFTLSDRDTETNPVSGGWDIRLLFLTEDRQELLQILSVEAAYSVSGGRREGAWSLSVPIEATEIRTLRPVGTVVLSRTKDSPPPSGRNDEAQVAEVAVSPLGVSVDFVTVEGHKYPCTINGKETACTVQLSSGATITPTYYGESWHNRRGWVMWEFDEPIDPGQVASITLNGNAISFTCDSGCPG